MTSVYEPYPVIDWIDCEWSGLSEEEVSETSCMVEEAVSRIWLPIFGPVNEDGSSLGFLLVEL
jgi:hypothetical protein